MYPAFSTKKFNLENPASNFFRSPVPWSDVLVWPIACFVPKTGSYSFKLDPEREKEEREAIFFFFAAFVWKHRDKTLSFFQLTAFSLQRKRDGVVSLPFKLGFSSLTEAKVFPGTVVLSSRTIQLFSNPKHRNITRGPPKLHCSPEAGSRLGKTTPTEKTLNHSSQQEVLLFDIVNSFYTCKQLAF